MIEVLFSCEKNRCPSKLPPGTSPSFAERARFVKAIENLIKSISETSQKPPLKKI
jgi:hypothetical protein